MKKARKHDTTEVHWSELGLMDRAAETHVIGHGRYSILGIRNVLEALELKTLNERYGDVTSIDQSNKNRECASERVRLGATPILPDTQWHNQG
jgi:hypothetical protein